MSNEKTKTKIVKKRRLKIKGVLILALFFLIIYSSINALIKVDISAVSVVGNEFLKDADVIKQAGFNNATKFLGFKSKTVCEKLKENPLISTCNIKRKIDFKVEIIIKENRPLFYYSSESATVLSDGSRLEGTNTYGIPTLINLTTEEELNEFIDGLSEVRSDIIRSIGEIEYAPSITSQGVYIDKERFVLSMNDGNTIYINNRHLDVLNRYDKIFASLGEKKGYLYFDADYGNYPFIEYGDE